MTSGYANGRWNGAGINSSAVAGNSGYGIGYADSADPGNPAGLSSGQIEIKYTLLGDANLDGVVNGDDFTILLGNLGKSVSAWDKGDFNYDGVVSGDDFTLLTGNLGKQSNAAAAVLPLSTPSVVAVTLSPSTVQPLSGVSTVLTQNNATSSNTVLTDQKQDQKSSALFRGAESQRQSQSR